MKTPTAPNGVGGAAPRSADGTPSPASLILSKYLRQPDRLPAAARARLEAAWGGEAVQLYALLDLDAQLRLQTQWLVLGPTQIAVVEADGTPKLILPRHRIQKTREIPGLSSITLEILGAPGEAPLALVRHTFRQRPAMAPILFVLEHQNEARAATAPVDPDTVYAEALAEPILKAQASVAQTRLTVFWRLMAFLKPYQGLVWLGFLTGVLLTALQLVPPFLSGVLVDHVVIPYLNGQISLEGAYVAGGWVLALVLVVYMARDFLVYLRLRSMTSVGEYVARDLRGQVYDHVHTLSVSYFSKEQTGSIISRVSSDTDRIWDFIAFGVTELTLATLMLFGLSAVLVALDPQLGLVLLAPVPLVFVAIYVMGTYMHRVFARVWRKWGALTAVLSDTIPGVRVVKAFSQEAHERNRFRERNEAVTAEAVRGLKIWSTYWPLIFFFLSLITALVWALALPRLLGTGTPESISLSPGTFVAFLLYMGLFIAPLESFGFLTRMINRSLSSAHRVFEVLDTRPEVVDVREPQRLEPIVGRVQFEDVTFGYDPVRLILKGINFDVRPGEMIGLVGPSGAGKTTVINLLSRFYDVSAGRILVDGVDLRQLDSAHYRQQIGLVQQDPYLFHGSVLDNIRYGHREASLDEVVAAARAANAHDFILKLPYAYDTIVGERGHTLSGGERQRVSIARAILRNPRILILDEATSSVDTETERHIQEAVDRLVAGRTVFAIAHRLSTLRRASRLFVLKDGRIVESGTHDELLAQEGGLYRKLHNMQRELHELYAV